MKRHSNKARTNGLPCLAALATLICSQAIAASIPMAQGDEQATAARWAAAVWEGAAQAPAPQNRVTIEKEWRSGGTMVGSCTMGGDLRLGDKTYLRGIGVNAPSVLRVTLTKPARRFQAVIGLDRNVDDSPGSARFYVKTDAGTLLASKVFKPGESTVCDVDLNGAREFTLEVDDGGDNITCDQGDWCDPKITLTDGSVVRLDDIASVAHVDTQTPFSFVYGGRSSREFLKDWRSESRKRALPGRITEYTRAFTDPATGLEVRLVGKLYPDTPAVDWTIFLKNRGSKPTPVIENVRALDLSFSPAKSRIQPSGQAMALMFANGSESMADEKGLPELHRMYGSTGCVAFTYNDFQPITDRLKVGGKVEFGQIAGRSSHEASPFYELAWGGGGVLYGIGWTGKWNAVVERPTQEIKVLAGMADLHTSLLPGEEIRTPRILQVFWTGDDTDRGYNLFRRTMVNHIIPRFNNKPQYPPISNLGSFFYENNRTTEAAEKRWIDAGRGLGFEYHWLDAWYMKGGYPAGVGNYTYPVSNIWDHERFPNGLKPVADHARAASEKFLLWFAPEWAMPGSTLTVDHPEWLLSTGGGASTVNLGNPAALDYLTGFFDAVIKELGIDIFRVDAGFELAQVKAFEKDPNRQGMMEIGCVEGLYKLWDGLRARNPGLIVDNCCGGGTRLDLESLSRSIPLWRTDGQCWTMSWRNKEMTAVQNQIITLSLNRFVPFSVGGIAGSEPYYVRSGFNGGLSFNDDLRAPDYPKAQLKKGIAECKRLRKYVLGDFHPLLNPGSIDNAWAALQYHLPKSGAGAIITFRRAASPYTGMAVQPKGIDPNARYRVTFYESYDPQSAKTMTGRELSNLKVAISTAPGSMLIEYVKLPGKQIAR